MKKLGTGIAVVLVVLFAAASVSAVEAPQLIHYQGVLRDASDLPLSGSFAMVFRFFDRDGGPTCSDPSELLLTDRHEGGASITASNGIFNVELGGGTLVAGAVESMNDLFRGRSDVWMEVEVDGESLCPRTRVLASAYAIGAARESASNIDTDLDTIPDTTLYVDGTTGDDSNDGLTDQTAKATIGAAIRAIPAVLNSNVFVRIAAGTYEETLYLSRRVRNGLYAVSLIGPDGASPSVVITPPQPVPEEFENGLTVSDDLVELRNLRFEGFPGDGVSAFGGGELILVDCELVDNEDGLFDGVGMEVVLENVQFLDNLRGVQTDNGRLFVSGVSFSGNGTSIQSNRASLIRFDSSSCTLDTAMVANVFTKVENFGSCQSPGGPSCSSLPVSSCCLKDGESACEP